MKDTFFKDTFSFLGKDINLSLSLSYIALIAIGMTFDVMYYREFDVNIIQFSDISDFLLTPFRDPFIIIFVAGSILFMFVTLIFDDWIEANYPKIYKSMYAGISQESYNNFYKRYNGTLIFIFIFVYFVAKIYGYNKADKIYKGNAPPITVIFKDNKFEPTDTLLYVGKTNNYTFLFNKGKKQIKIVPMSDVLRLELNRK